jgi:hypothetical protein
MCMGTLLFPWLALKFKVGPCWAPRFQVRKKTKRQREKDFSVDQSAFWLLNVCLVIIDVGVVRSKLLWNLQKSVFDNAGYKITKS